jgi:hypothetical protein
MKMREQHVVPLSRQAIALATTALHSTDPIQLANRCDNARFRDRSGQKQLAFAH